MLEEKKKSYLHWPGIEPGPPAWQARILPLNHQCLFVVDIYEGYHNYAMFDQGHVLVIVHTFVLCNEHQLLHVWTPPQLSPHPHRANYAYIMTATGLRPCLS